MSSPSGRSAGPTYEQAAWSWTEHLLGGGTTSWTDWSHAGTSGAAADVAVPQGWRVPGAAQLELLRRLWTERIPDDAARDHLAELVLSRSGPGRGLAQQPLSWPAARRDFGPPPADPAAVPVPELLRLGVGSLVELLLESAPTSPPAAPRRGLLTRTPSFLLAGAPVTTSDVRRSLAASGHLEGGHAPVVLVFGEPLDVALAQVWTGRVQGGAAVRWRGFVDRWAHRRRLPPSVDLVALARAHARRAGVDRVHLVVGPGDVAARAAAETLDVPLTSGSRSVDAPPGQVWPLSPAATDVARRVNAVLHVRVPADRRRRESRRLAALLAASDGATATDLTVPRRFRAWVEDTAARQADALRADGYPVHGDVGGLVPRADGRPTGPVPSDALQVVVRACLEQATRSTPHPAERHGTVRTRRTEQR